MDRNICEDGSAVIDRNSNNCLVAWYHEKDNTSNGPVTAMNYLKQATSNWMRTNKLIIESFTEPSVPDTALL